MPRARPRAADGVMRDVDLGSHVGLLVEGDSEAAGSDDEAAIVYTSAMAGMPLGAILTHRNLLANARSTIGGRRHCRPTTVSLALLPFSHLFGLTVTGTAPSRGRERDDDGALQSGESARAARALDATAVVGVPAVFRALFSVLERRGSTAGRTLAPLHLRRRLLSVSSCRTDGSTRPAWSCAQGYGLH